MGELLSDEVAVVTGGASGIGRRISTTLAEYGADVVVADLQAEPREGGTPTDELVEEAGQQAVYAECDVTDTDDLERAVDAADPLGGVSVMVNNAGLSASQPFLEIGPEEYQRLMDVNVRGPFFGSQVAARRMVAEDRAGAIVNVASISGITGRGTGVHYCASKGAVRLMTYAMAAALGPEDIRVNAVCPGVVETPMTREDLRIFEEEGGPADTYRRAAPLGRVGQPDDIADAVLYLASPLADFVTGESLVVDGGATNTWSGVTDG